MKQYEDIFSAARGGNLEQLNSFLVSGASVTEVNDFGFTALQCAAMGSNLVDENKIVAVIQRLIEAGSPLEYAKEDGRTALYLAAEFSPTLRPVQILIEAGAKANIFAYGDVHIVANAMSEKVQEYLSDLTGCSIPEDEPEILTQKMTAQQWKAAFLQIDEAFIELSKLGIITLHDAGTTQEDGFNDCSQIYLEQKNISHIYGFCFYSRQDQDRAKKTGQLCLSFWGAPEGEDEIMIKVGKQIVDIFKNAGFTVYWNGTASDRPIIYLHNMKIL